MSDKDQFGMYVSSKPSLKIYVGNNLREFKDGLLRAENKEDEAAIDEALATMAPSGRMLIRKVSVEQAQAIVAEHKAKTKEMTGAAAGQYHSLAQRRAPVEEALEARDMSNPGIEAREDFTPTEKVDQPSAAPVQVKTLSIKKSKE